MLTKTTIRTYRKTKIDGPFIRSRMPRIHIFGGAFEEIAREKIALGWILQNENKNEIELTFDNGDGTIEMEIITRDGLRCDICQKNVNHGGEPYLECLMQPDASAKTYREQIANCPIPRGLELEEITIPRADENTIRMDRACQEMEATINRITYLRDIIAKTRRDYAIGKKTSDKMSIKVLKIRIDSCQDEINALDARMERIENDIASKAKGALV